MLPQFSVLERPTAILTIENYASFNRQVREIEDGKKRWTKKSET
jgi:hypothetical protein